MKHSVFTLMAGVIAATVPAIAHAQPSSMWPDPQWFEGADGNSFVGRMTDLDNGLARGIRGGGPINWDVRVYKGDFDRGGAPNDLYVTARHLLGAGAPLLRAGLLNVIPGGSLGVPPEPIPDRFIGVSLGHGLDFDNLSIRYSSLFPIPGSSLGVIASHTPAALYGNNGLPPGFVVPDAPMAPQNWTNVPAPGALALVTTGAGLIGVRRRG